MILLVFFINNCAALVEVITSSQSKRLTRSVAVTQASHIGGGFFCEFNGVLTDLIYYEQDGIKSMYVDWKDQFFPYKNKPDENGWDLYFEPIQVDTSKINLDEAVHKVGNAPVHELHDQLCVAPWLRYDDYLPYRQFVHDKIEKHIRIKQHILDQVQAFYDQHMKDHFCVGVHVRYAHAHTQETPAGHPPLHEYCIEVDRLIARRGDKVKIFLATDSFTVVNHFKNRYGNMLVYIDTYRAANLEDPGLIYEDSQFWINHPAEWHRSKPGYVGGLGALMDCLLLARCEHFIHITSNLATYVCFFNPHIKSIYLPHTVQFSHCRYRGDSSIRNKFLNPI